MTQKYIIDPPWPFATKEELEDFIEELESYDDPDNEMIQEYLNEAKTRLNEED